MKKKMLKCTLALAAFATVGAVQALPVEGNLLGGSVVYAEENRPVEVGITIYLWDNPNDILSTRRSDEYSVKNFYLNRPGETYRYVFPDIPGYKRIDSLDKSEIIVEYTQEDYDSWRPDVQIILGGAYTYVKDVDYVDTRKTFTVTIDNGTSTFSREVTLNPGQKFDVPGYDPQEMVIVEGSQTLHYDDVYGGGKYFIKLANKNSQAPKPNDPKPEAPKPDTSRPEAPKPDTSKPEAPKPDTSRPEVPKPDTSKPEVPKPDTSKPGAPKSDTSKPGAPKPDTSKPGAPKPDTSKPEAPKPDTSKPKAPKSDTPKSDVQPSNSLTSDAQKQAGKVLPKTNDKSTSGIIVLLSSLIIGLAAYLLGRKYSPNK